MWKYLDFLKENFNILLNVPAILTQIDTNRVQDSHNHALQMQIILSILFYMLLANIIIFLVNLLLTAKLPSWVFLDR